MKKIVIFHLFNNYSGSPHVLSLIIKGLVDKGYSIDLYTSRHKGFLSDIDGIKYYKIYYNFFNNKIITFFIFILAQIRYFFAILKYARKKNTLIYINTILPFGASIGANFIGKKVFYHIHENPVKINPVNTLALKYFHKYTDKTIFVSKYLFDSFKIEENKKRLVYNALSPNFVEKAQNHVINLEQPYNLLMVCSLRIFKGVFVFVDLANRLPDFSFTLVLNATDEEINQFFKHTVLPKNLEIFSTKTDLHPYYSKAHLVVNLSLPDLWIETFGLTALEAMVYGIPVIVPPVGGISEIVDDSVQGYKIDARNTDNLIQAIHKIFNDKENYLKMSSAAKSKAKDFSYEKMVNNIEQIFNE